MNNYQIDRQRWAKFTINEQMGNIASEVGRSIKAWRDNDELRFQAALGRAIDLFDATTEVLIREKSPRVKEVLRSKDQFLALFFDGKFDQDADSIEKYFMRYAFAARADR